jgi:hypothetical protein
MSVVHTYVSVLFCIMRLVQVTDSNNRSADHSYAIPSSLFQSLSLHDACELLRDYVQRL